jgi:hypothetical protein
MVIRLNGNPLDLVERDLADGVIVELGGAWAFIRHHPVERTSAKLMVTSSRPRPIERRAVSRRRDGEKRHPVRRQPIINSRLIIPDHAIGLPVLRALSLCTCCRHYPGAADGRSLRSCYPSVSAFPDSTFGSACTSSEKRRLVTAHVESGHSSGVYSSPKLPVSRWTRWRELG